MTRRLRTADLPALTIAGQPAISPDASRIAYVVRGNDLEADKPVESIWLTDAAGSARRLTQGTGDSTPAFSPGWRDPRLPARRPAVDAPAGRRRAGQAHEPPDLRRRAAVEPGLHPHRLHRARRRRRGRGRGRLRPRAPRRRARSSPTALGYQVDGMGFVRGMRMQLHVLDLASGDGPSADRRRRPRRRCRVEPRLGEARVHRDAARRRTSTRARPCTSSTPPTSRHGPRSSPSATGSPAPSRSRPTARRSSSSAGRARSAATPACSPSTSRPARRRQLAASLNRNVMPGAPAYPGALPQFTDAGDVLFAVRDRGCTHLYAVSLGGGEPRLVHGGDGNVVSGLSVAGSSAAIALATPTSFGEIVLLDLAVGRREDGHRARVGSRRHRALRPRVARVRDQRRRSPCRAGSSATPRSPVRRRC